LAIAWPGLARQGIGMAVSEAARVTGFIFGLFHIDNLNMINIMNLVYNK
jgi:hypothetical protein